MLHGRPRAGQRSAPGLLDRDPATQRDGRAHAGARAEQHHPGHPGAQGAHGGQGGALAAGHGPRRHRHPERRREDPAQGGRDQASRRPRARGARGQDLGMEGEVRRHHPAPAPRAGGVVRLVPHPVHDGPGLLAVRAGRVRGPVPQGPHLPRQAHGELVPGVPHGVVGRGGGHEGAEGLHVPLPGRGGGTPGNVPYDCHDAPGDDPGGHGGGGEPEGSALCAPGGPARLAGVAAGCSQGPARHPDHRGRPRGLRVWDGRAQGDAGARQGRLRDRPAPQAAGDRRADARRQAHGRGGRGPGGPGSLRRAQEGGRAARRGRAHS